MSLDLERLKETIDCRQLVEHDLGQPNRRSSKSWQWRCPLHQEQKGYSLVVWANCWRCFGACQLSGDAIAWLQHFHNLDFKTACAALGTSDSWLPVQPRQPQSTPKARVSEPPSPEWQSAAGKVVDLAEGLLWSKAGEQALAYLGQGRGLFKATIRSAHLGYIPGAVGQWEKLFGLNVPCGITIPWYADGVLWGIKVRRLEGDVRYEQVGGGNIAGSLYGVDDILPRWPVLLVEGEFNCLIASQEACDLICAVSLGSASSSINPRWFATLATNPRILACYDSDAAGDKSIARLASLTHRVQFIRVPAGKDINEYYLLNRTQPLTIFRWLEDYLTDRRNSQAG